VAANHDLKMHDQPQQMGKRNYGKDERAEFGETFHKFYFSVKLTNYM